MFEEHGKKLDNAIEDFHNAIVKPFTDRIKEAATGLKESIKTAEQRGFERGRDAAAAHFRNFTLPANPPLTTNFMPSELKAVLNHVAGEIDKLEHTNAKAAGSSHS